MEMKEEYNSYTVIHRKKRKIKINELELLA